MEPICVLNSPSMEPIWVPLRARVQQVRRHPEPF
nr:MAG TPA: hypothetical protein [Caudoviricetes sp.]